MNFDFNLKKKIILGTAQFGFNYGEFNKTGQTQFAEVTKIINDLNKNDIKNIDTAPAYKESEYILGKIGVSNFSIISKIAFLKADFDNLDYWFENEINKSLVNLNLTQLNTILIHDYDYLTFDQLKKIFKTLYNFKNQLFLKIGISTYSIKKYIKQFSNFDIDVIQTNYNIFDRKIEDNKFIDIIKNNNINLHVRSIFLQGLLISKFDNIPDKFKKNNSIFIRWDKFLKNYKFNSIDYCLNFVLLNPYVDGIVIGFDAYNQYKQILKIKRLKDFIKFDYHLSDDDKIINPFLWNKL